MKKYYFLIIMGLYFSPAGNAQHIQERLQTKNLDAFVGAWEYASPTDTFRVVLKKGISSLPWSYHECVLGGYRHVKQGLLMGDYTGNIPSQFLYKDLSVSDTGVTIEGTNAFSDPDEIYPDQIRILFKDRKLGKMTQSGRMILLSPTQAHWILENDEGEYALEPGENPPIMGFSVPRDVTLTRISLIPPVDLPRWNRPFLPPQDNPPVPPQDKPPVPPFL